MKHHQEGGPLRPPLLFTLIGLLAFLLLAAAPGRAQAPYGIASLDIWLWPEYDQPGVLVFLIGQLEEGASLPAQITFDLPAGARINAVAWQDASGALFDAEHTTTADSLTLTSPNGSFHIEFYDDTLRINGDERAYSYTFTPRQPVQVLAWQVQQPLLANNLAIEPIAGVTTLSGQGLPLYIGADGPLEVGQAFSVDVRYNKQGTALTTDLLAQQAASAPPAQPARVEQGQIGPFLFYFGLIGVIVALMGLVALHYLRRASAQPRCPNCNQSIGPREKFCAHCGHKLA